MSGSSGVAIPDEELRDWLALNRVAGLAPRVARCLLGHTGSAGGALRADEALLRRIELRPALAARLRSPDWPGVDRDLDWLSHPGRSLLRLHDGGYPPRLAEIADPPLVLFAQGDLEVLAWPQLALVGSRSPTPPGRETAREFAAALAAAGLVITSGLALGIDAAAHRGAIGAGVPSVAVGGRGLDEVYPAAHRELAKAIAGQGVLVSEFPIGTPPARHTFPRRNRIISGLCLGVLVVEASVRSGALITARFATEQGREVFAIPGSIHNPMARGCHRLIRQGAKLVESVADVLEELAGVVHAPPLHPPDASPAPRPGAVAGFDEDYERVLEGLGYEPTAFDSVVRRAALTPQAVSSILLALELRGYVESTPGGLYARTLKGSER